MSDAKPQDAKPHLWEKQPWETPTAFARFHEYYLSQDAPRTLRLAFYNYRVNRTVEKGGKAQDVDPARAPDGTWQKWYRGEDSNGKPIPGAVGWAERATAFDGHVINESVATMADLRNAERMRALAASDRHVEWYEELARNVPIFMRSRRGQPKLVNTKIDGKKVTEEYIVTETISLDISGIARMVNLHADIMAQRWVILGMGVDLLEEDKTIEDESITEMLNSIMDELADEGYLNRNFDVPELPAGLDVALETARKQAQIPGTFSDYSGLDDAAAEDADDLQPNTKRSQGAS